MFIKNFDFPRQLAAVIKTTKRTRIGAEVKREKIPTKNNKETNSAFYNDYQLNNTYSDTK